MYFSNLLAPTLREIPAEAEVVSHQLLLRAGFIRKSSSGIYTYLPLGMRVIQKIEAIVREEMNKAGGQEILMPIVQAADCGESRDAGMFTEKNYSSPRPARREFAWSHP